MRSKTLHGLSESELATHQSRQIGNTCTFHAITTGLRLLLNVEIDPMALSAEVDRLWLRGRLMRTFPGWAVTPRMQVRIVRYLAETRNLPVRAVYHRGIPEILPGLLADDDLIPIVTLIWLWHQAPPIYHGEDPRNLHTTQSPGGHSMLLGAYDPEHRVGESIHAPWGFINPWKANTTHLYWMSDPDFRKAWQFKLPFNGPNPLVLIRRTN